MKKYIKTYRIKNDFRLFMNSHIWKKLERHGFSKLAKNIMHMKKYGKRTIHGDDWSNNKIIELLNDDKPCMIARFGLTEMNFLISYMNYIYKDSKNNYIKLVDAMNRLCLLSGFFPNDLKLAKKFFDEYINSIPLMDLCGVWNLYMEDYILDRYAPKCSLTELKYLEPWNTSKEVTWSSALKGKKVLVIHPFKETIEKQYKKHRDIFSNRFFYEDILPDFELYTIEAVQSLGGENSRFDNWFDALDFMVEEIHKIDFDIAIIGCGAYGLPLAAEVKKMGKKAIHLGGATQLMFGIWGNRWEQIPSVKELYNDVWVRPSDDEKPRRADDVENGCYW